MLLSYDKATKRIQLRHYSISAQPSGVSKSVKALVSQRAVPDMGAIQDVSELLSKSGYGSVSFWHCALTENALPLLKTPCPSTHVSNVDSSLSIRTTLVKEAFVVLVFALSLV